MRSRRPASPRPTWCAIRSSHASSRRMTRRAATPARKAEVKARGSASARDSRPPLALSLQLEDDADRTILAPARVRRWLRAALERPAELTLRVVGEEEGLALNRTYRGQRHATNVLTFDYAREPAVVADLVLCAPV